MLSSRTTRLGWASMAFGVVGDHDPPDDVGQMSFQAAHGRAWGCSGGDPAVVIGAASAGGHADLDHGDGVDGSVELPVSVTAEPMYLTVGAGDLDRRGAVVGGVGGCGREPCRRTGASDQPSS